MIIRANKSFGNFTQVSNKLLKDTDLSFQAKGLMCYILSHTDNFEFSTKQLSKVSSKNGDASIRSILKELEDKGYLKKKGSIKGKSGRFSGFEWYVFEDNNLENIYNQEYNTPS